MSYKITESEYFNEIEKIKKSNASIPNNNLLKKEEDLKKFAKKRRMNLAKFKKSRKNMLETPYKLPKKLKETSVQRHHPKQPIV